MAWGFSPRPRPEAFVPSDEPLVIPRIDGPIELDGSPVEAVWTEARWLPAVQQTPSFGNEPSEETTFLVGHTKDYLYVACRCYDRGAPSATSFKRDYFSGDTDYFILVLDTFNDDENALAFEARERGTYLREPRPSSFPERALQVSSWRRR